MIVFAPQRFLLGHQPTEVPRRSLIAGRSRDRQYISDLPSGFVAKLRELTEHARVIAVRHDAPDDEWVALARAAHELHPFTRIATFGETDQDRCAVIGEALGIVTHSPRTVELVYDKREMRVASRNWYRLNGFRGSRRP